MRITYQKTWSILAESTGQIGHRLQDRPGQLGPMNDEMDNRTTDHTKSRQVFTVGPDPVIVTLQLGYY